MIILPTPVVPAVGSPVLQIVQAFCREYALPVPSAILGTSDAGGLQMLGILQLVGDYILGITNWEQTAVYAAWPSVAGSYQGALATLFPLGFTQIIPTTLWDLTDKRPLRGPLTIPQWQTDSASTQNSFPPFTFSVYGGRLYTSPTTPAGHTFACYYKSSRWILSNGAPVANWAADSDTCLFSDALMKAGLRAFWLRVKQMPHRFEMELFEDLALKEASLRAFLPPVDIAAGAAPSGIAISLWNTVP